MMKKDMADKKVKKESKVTKETFLIVFVLGLLVFIVSYFGVYMNLTEKAEAMESSNRELRKEVEARKLHFDNLQRYRQETAGVIQAINEICDAFPADAREEDALMMAVGMQQEAVVNFSSVSMTDSRYIHGIPTETLANGGWQESTGEVVFAAREVSYLNETNYGNLKECIRGIYQYAEDHKCCVGIQNLNYVLNENNQCLDGVIDLTFYSLQGTGKEYEPPVISDYNSGKADLFELFSRR